MTPNKLHCPVKYLIVEIEKKLYDTIKFDSGVELHIDPSWHPEEFSMMEAKVISVPDKVGGDQSYANLQIQMKPGDKILMRYDVIFAYKEQPDRDTPIYKNMFMYGGKEYWKCSISQVFAYIRNGKITMVNEWVMCDIVEEPNPNYSDIIVTPDNHKTIRSREKMIVRHIGKPFKGQKNLPVHDGDTVYVDPQFVATYKINEDEFHIIRQGRIIARAS